MQGQGQGLAWVKVRALFMIELRIWFMVNGRTWFRRLGTGCIVKVRVRYWCRVEVRV